MITPARKARLQARLTSKQTYLEQLYTARENFDEVESYSFDSGEGRQQTKFRSISEVVKEITKIEAEIERLYREIEGTNIVSVNVRRM